MISSFDDDGTLRSHEEYIQGKIVEGYVYRGTCDENGKYKKLELNWSYEEISEDEYRKYEKDEYQYIRFANFKIVEGKYIVDGDIKYGKKSHV